MAVKDTKPFFSEEVYRKTEHSLVCFLKKYVRETKTELFLFFAFWSILLATIFAASVWSMIWNHEILIGIFGILFSLAALAFFSALVYHGRRVTLDSRGLYAEFMLYGFLSVWHRFPLESVTGFFVRTELPRNVETLAAKIASGNGKFRWKTLLELHGGEDALRKVAQDANDLLRRLKAEENIFVSDGESESVLMSEMGRFAECPGERPGDTLWETREADGVLTFTRREAFSRGEILMAFLYTVLWFLVGMTLAANAVLIPPPDIFGWLAAAKILCFSAGMLCFPVAVYAFYRFVVKGTAPFRWEFYEIDKTRIRWGHRIWGAFGGTDMSLEGCAEMKIYGRGQDFHEAAYRLAFLDGDGKTLAEMTDLTKTEARWMRGEILRFWSTDSPPAVPERIPEMSAEETLTVLNRLGVWQRTETSLRMLRGKFSAERLLTGIFVGGMLVFFLCILGNAPAEEMPFCVFHAPVPAEMMSAGNGVNFLMLGVRIFFAAYILFPVIFLAGGAYLSLAARESWTLDETGFRYVYSAIFPLKKIRIPPDRLFGFRAVTREGAWKYDSLILKTTLGEITLFQNSYKVSRREGKNMPAFRCLAAEGNRVLSRLKGAEISEVTRTETETVPLTGAAEKISRPEGSRWRVVSEENGVIFGKRVGFQTADAVFSVFLIGLICLFGIGGWWLFSEMPTWGVLTEADGKMLPRMFFFFGAVPLLILLLTGWAVCRLYSAVTAAFRLEVFGLQDKKFLRGNRFFAYRWKETLPAESCVKAAISDRAPESGWIRFPDLWKRPAPPGYVLELRTAEGETGMELPGLTREEARWMRDEILRNL